MQLPSQPALAPGTPLLQAWQQTNLREQHQARHRLSHRYSWAIPTEPALAALAGLSPILEVGAGTGYWAALRHGRGARVTALDLHPVEDGKQPGPSLSGIAGKPVRSWFPVGPAPQPSEGANEMSDRPQNFRPVHDLLRHRPEVKSLDITVTVADRRLAVSAKGQQVEIPYHTPHIPAGPMQQQRAECCIQQPLTHYPVPATVNGKEVPTKPFPDQALLSIGFLPNQILDLSARPVMQPATLMPQPI